MVCDRILGSASRQTGGLSREPELQEAFSRRPEMLGTDASGDRVPTVSVTLAGREPFLHLTRRSGPEWMLDKLQTDCNLMALAPTRAPLGQAENSQCAMPKTMQP